MRNAILLLIIIIIFSSCKTTAQTDLSFHPIVQKAKEVSLYSDNINWSEVNKTFVELTKGKESVEDLKEGLQYLINSLGDKHAHVRSTSDFSIIVSYRGEKEEDDIRKGEFINTVINDIETKFSYKLLEEGVGYLKIVAIGGGDVMAQSDFIRHGLIELKAKGVDKWVLDLRYNGGGNMDPMISGIAPLLGDGFIGGAVNRRNEMSELTIKNGQFYNWGRLACEMDKMSDKIATEKVAVLLSRYTTSSGEMLAITFKGRDNTIFIGEESSGYTTGNGYDPVTDDLALIISRDVFMDRNKKRYDMKVGVDEYVEFQHNTELDEDNSIQKALEWLKN